MRKVVGTVLVGLGVFFLVAGVIAVTWAPGAVKKTPLDTDSTTQLSGELATLDTTAGELGPVEPLIAVSKTRADSDASTDEVVVFTNEGCANIDEGQPSECYDPDEYDFVFRVSQDFFATDRVTALAVDADLENEAVLHEGLVNKWPFDARQETYPYWDGTIQQAVDAVYDRTEELEGLETYVYRVEIADAPVKVSGLSEEIDGTYDSVKELFVDPRTGSIIKQTEDQQRYFDDGTQALELSLAFTDEQVADNVAAAEDSIARLDTLLKTVPLVGFIGGALLVVLGGLLIAVSSRSSDPHGGGARRQPVSAPA